jgi:hypothetical protein
MRACRSHYNAFLKAVRELVQTMRVRLGLLILLVLKEASGFCRVPNDIYCKVPKVLVKAVRVMQRLLEGWQRP